MILDAIRNILSQRPTSPSPASSAAPGDPVASEVRVAACALLLELAYADGEFSAEEQKRIEEALARHFGLDAETTQKLLAVAADKRGESIDHFSFTRTINQQFDLSQKMVLAEVMWGVILADGKIEEHEAYLMRKLGNLLNLQPAYLSEARRSAAAPDDG